MFFRILLFFLIFVPILDLVSLSLIPPGYFQSALVIGVAVGGGILCLFQWQKIWKRYQSQFAPGAMPTDMILNSVLVLIAAVLFITPGFFSDMIALLFLFPITRGIIVFLVIQQYYLFQAAKFQKKYQQNQNWSQNSSKTPSTDDEFIDVDFKK